MATVHWLSIFKGTCLALALSKWEKSRVVYWNKLKSSVCPYIPGCVASLCQADLMSEQWGRKLWENHPLVRNSLAMACCKFEAYHSCEFMFTMSCFSEDPFPIASSATGLSFRWCVRKSVLADTFKVSTYLVQTGAEPHLSANIRVFICTELGPVPCL